MEIGICHTEEITVTESLTASAMGSGTLKVFATPAMTALMEKACFECVAPYLDEGITTVGTSLNIEHTAATPVGMKVKAKGTLTETDGRKLVFEVEAYDEKGLIGKGTHERFTVKSESFTEKTYSKLN